MFICLFYYLFFYNLTINLFSYRGVYIVNLYAMHNNKHTIIYNIFSCIIIGLKD
jgi:hypothetical protein